MKSIHDSYTSGNIPLTNWTSQWWDITCVKCWCHTQKSVKCWMTVCNRSVQTNYFKYVEHFHINKSFGEISMIIRNKQDPSWERGPGRLLAALCILTFVFHHVEFGCKTVGLLYSTKNRMRVRCRGGADGAKAVRVTASGRWWKQWKANGKKWLPACLSSSVEPERKTFDWRGEHHLCDKKQRVLFRDTVSLTRLIGSNLKATC